MHSSAAYHEALKETLSLKSQQPTANQLYDVWQHARNHHDILLMSLGYAPPLPIGSVVLSEPQMERIEQAKEREHRAWLMYWARVKAEMPKDE